MSDNRTELESLGEFGLIDHLTKEFENRNSTTLFGIGDQVILKSVEEIAMGQMGGALNSEYQLSFTNPASFGSLSYTTYVFSGGNKTNFVNDGENKGTSSAAALSFVQFNSK